MFSQYHSHLGVFVLGFFMVATVVPARIFQMDLCCDLDLWERSFPDLIISHGRSVGAPPPIAVLWASAPASAFNQGGASPLQVNATACSRL
jgi:hypothetical protein